MRSKIAIEKKCVGWDQKIVLIGSKHDPERTLSIFGRLQKTARTPARHFRNFHFSPNLTLFKNGVDNLFQDQVLNYLCQKFHGRNRKMLPLI